MKHLIRSLCLLALAVGAIAFPCAPARAADLAADIAKPLQDKLLHRAVVGIEIVRLGTSPGDAQPVYANNAHQPLIPASNLKLVTTSAALERFGPDFRFRTMLLLNAEGDLILVGDGDPSFGDGEYLKKVGWGITTVYENWAEQLKSRNITTVRNVVVDDSVFDETFAHPHWPTDQIHMRYEAGVGGVNLNANCVDFSVRSNGPGQLVGYGLEPDTKYVTVRNTCVAGGENAVWLSRSVGVNDIVLRGTTRGSTVQSVTIHDPPMYAATVLAETLAARGVRVTGQVKRDRGVRAQVQQQAGRQGPFAAPHLGLVAVHETPLPAVLARCNKDSMNLYAESLCKRLGFAATGASGSWENGTAAVGAYLKSIGIADAEFHLDDGSGLSKENAISAPALTTVLIRDFYGKSKETFLASLSVAGSDGTLEDRFRGEYSDLRGRVIGKSGYVNGVRSLSGFLKAKDDRWYAFSILMNKTPGAAQVKVLQEQILKAVDTHAGGQASTASAAEGR
jgi:D-alanyl-D-alanine carboxypeptidase/D-alanyl-D-alanine-endopeptidase (penicillin-binding protein 4)